MNIRRDYFDVSVKLSNSNSITKLFGLGLYCSVGNCSTWEEHEMSNGPPVSWGTKVDGTFRCSVNRLFWNEAVFRALLERKLLKS